MKGVSTNELIEEVWTEIREAFEHRRQWDERCPPNFKMVLEAVDKMIAYRLAEHSLSFIEQLVNQRQEKP